MATKPDLTNLASQGLLIVDMQNDFVRPGAPQEVPRARSIVPTIARLAATFRSAGQPVLYTRFVSGPNSTLITRWSPECGPDTRSCWPGEWRLFSDTAEKLEGFDIIPELVPHERDVLIDKYGYGAFYGTALRDILDARSVRQVVVCGVVTQICVEDTVRQGLQQGFEMIVAQDAVASFDETLHQSSLRNIEMKFGYVCDSTQWLLPTEVKY